MRGPFTVTAVVVLAAAIFLLQVTAKEEDDPTKLIGKRIDELTSELYSLDRKLDARLDPKRIQKGGSLKARVDAIAEPSCEDENYQCGGDDPQCINNLFVCDGEKDCRNGEDEKHCVVPLKKGDVFVGDRVFDHCGKLHPDHITISIESVTTSSFFTSHPKLTATLHIHVDREEDEAEVAVLTSGFYSFATHRVIFRTPDDDNLYVIGHFDGYNFDQFIGESVSVGTDTACARFLYKRKH